MSAYDVYISKLLDGKRELEGAGKYLVCTPDKKFLEADSLHESRII